MRSRGPETSCRVSIPRRHAHPNVAIAPCISTQMDFACLGCCLEPICHRHCCSNSHKARNESRPIWTFNCFGAGTSCAHHTAWRAQASFPHSHLMLSDSLIAYPSHWHSPRPSTPDRPRQNPISSVRALQCHPLLGQLVAA